MSVSCRPPLPAVLLSLALALAGCGWEVPPVEELPPLVLSPDAGTPGRPPPTNPGTTGTLPDAPTGVVATAGDGSVQVTWNPANGNGARVLSYQVTIRDATTQAVVGGTNVPAPSTGLHYRGLAPHYGYHVTVSTISDVGTGLPSKAVLVVPYLGSCNTVLWSSGGRASSGVYRLNLPNASLDAYCEMDPNTGGWTLVLHSAWTDQLPTDGGLYQELSGWRSVGVGWPGGFGGHYGSAPYVMPLELMRALLEDGGGGRQMRFQSDGAQTLALLFGARMNPDFGLTGYNASEVASRLCGATVDCFIEPAAPFATPELTSAGGQCARNSHGLGWWYQGAGCARHHPFRTDSRPLFSGNSADPLTNHWTWWVQ
jgi:hypothetical protein